MDKEDLQEMKEDRLADYAVVVFLGALLMGQAWEIWEGRSAKLLGIFEVPNLAELVILTIMAMFVGWSLLLALSSIVKPLQGWGLRTLRGSSQLLGSVVIFLFLLSWLSSVSELPDDRWWTTVLIWGGFGILFFLLYRVGFSHLTTPLFRFLNQRFSWYVLAKPRDAAESEGANQVEQSEAPESSTPFLERVRSLCARCQWPESRGFWVSVSAAVGVGGMLVGVVWWDWLSEGASRSEVIRNVGLLVAGLVAFPLAIWRALVADRQASAAQRQTATAQQGLLNERYQKGADMLGSEVLSVRLGGVFALQSLAWEYPEQYYLQCIRLLCAFVRNPTKDDSEDTSSDVYYRYDARTPKLREDVQAIMDFIGLRDDALIALEFKERFLLNLRRANLKHAALEGANLSNIDLNWANLSDARLAGANLSGAWLFGATLSGTKFCNVGVDGYVTSPAHGLNSYNLSHAYSDPNDPPELGGVVLDSDTRQPLVWSGESIQGEEDK